MNKPFIICTLVAVCMMSCDAKHTPVADLESLTNRMCACQTSSCVDGVNALFATFQYKHTDFVPSPSQNKQLSEVLKRLMNCAMKFQAPNEPIPVIAEKETPPCGGKPCLAVPNGIKGLAFGMSVKEVANALGADEPSVVANKPRQILPSKDLVDPIDRLTRRRPTNIRESHAQHAQSLPGTTAVVETTIGKRPSVCLLDFDTSKQLAGIFCSIESRSDDELDTRFFNGLVGQLTGKYGKPTAERIERFEWRSTTAVLECSRDYRGAQLNSFSAAHGKVIAATLTRANLEMKRAISAAETAAKKEAAAKEAELREEIRALDSDTSSAAENANATP